MVSTITTQQEGPGFHSQLWQGLSLTLLQQCTPPDLRTSEIGSHTNGHKVTYQPCVCIHTSMKNDGPFCRGHCDM